MPQQNGPQKVRSRQQMIEALELRAAGASYRQIGKTLGVSGSRAWKIVAKALDELEGKCQETAERVRRLELIRLDRLRLALDSMKSDPQVANVLLRISERVAKMHGLDAPQRIEASGPDGGPIQTRGDDMDLSKLSVEELLQLEALHKKATAEAVSTASHSA